MAKKRGGLAGLYDRNKGLFRTAAILGGTALGGPAGGAIAGAAMRGLDRPGKRGIGFDVGQGIRGGVEGYMMGKTAQSVGGGLKNLFTAKGAPVAAEQAAQAVMPDLPGIGFGLGGQAPAADMLPPLKAIPGITSRTVSAGYDPLAEFTRRAPSLMTAGQVPISSPSPNPSLVQQLLSGLTQRQGQDNRPLYYDLLSGTGKGLYAMRESQRKDALSRAELAEKQRTFDAMLPLYQQDRAIAAAQEADRKRREEQRMANREALRALFTGA